MELRPLGFGEIFDRAVTLYVRNLVPFVTIVIAFVLPISILQYLLDLGSQPEFYAILQMLRHPTRGHAPHIPALFESPGQIVILIATLFLTYLLWPFALNAVAVGVAALYRNRPVVFRASYEIVLRRWLQIVGLILLDFVVALVWYVATVLLLVAVVVAALLGKVSARRRCGSGLGFSAQSSFLSSRFRCSHHYTLRSPFPCTRWRLENAACSNRFRSVLRASLTGPSSGGRCSSQLPPGLPFSADP